MKKFLLICLFFNFILGISQEKKISFTKEIRYTLIEKKKSQVFIKSFASNKGEFLTQANIREFPVYFFTDALGTSSVGLEMNNRLNGSNAFASSMFFGYNRSQPENKEECVLESKKLDTKETILGVPCSHYIVNFKLKDGESKGKDAMKLCIDDKSDYNNIPVLSGIFTMFERRSKIKNSGLKGLILKGGPAESYDTEYFVASSMKDSESFVYFDHKKAMMDQQRQMDSLTLAYKKQEEEYAKADSAAVLIDSAAAVALDSVAMAEAPNGTMSDEYSYYIPDYVSEYKKGSTEDSSLAMTNIPNQKLWKGLPKHCKNFEKDLPSFNNKDLKSHLKNYVGQVCDMYLTQSEGHNVGIKITLDEIRREVLYLNEIQEKLDQSDKKKLNTYLKNLD
ncbi:hypothetical protein SAMN05421841_3772 [Chryseobacterium wanjuense]|uniref:Uncharacterized protein n=1 Tax=Chryseobacterium wanjuense TaxID=356305 RepID=A0A1I0S1L0_9FLAO|nr:hypothetical protein [Chryseobacterium wanjuense]SEW48274.1 hypothetical protein SAMN05421841_3772 [Chryseobacterium wanjuense]